MFMNLNIIHIFRVDVKNKKVNSLRAQAWFRGRGINLPRPKGGGSPLETQQAVPRLKGRGINSSMKNMGSVPIFCYFLKSLNSSTGRVLRRFLGSSHPLLATPTPNFIIQS